MFNLSRPYYDYMLKGVLIHTSRVNMTRDKFPLDESIAIQRLPGALQNTFASCPMAVSKFHT